MPSSTQTQPTGSTDDIIYSSMNIDPSSESVDIKSFEENITEICSNKDNKIMFLSTYHIKTLYQHGTNGDIIFPLQMCCLLGCSLATIKLVLKQNPLAIEYASAYKGMKCLHYCVLYHRAPLDVIQYIIKKEPNQLSSGTTTSLLTPLHIACMCPTAFTLFNPEVVMILTELGTATVCMNLDQYGRTPLHIACLQKRPSLQIVEDLTEVNGAACLVQCSMYKATPLHALCSNEHISDKDIYESFIDTIKDLLRTKPEACHMTDNDNEIPLEVALHNKAHFKIMRLLTKKYTPPSDRMMIRTSSGSNNKISYHDYIKQNYPSSQQDDIMSLFAT